jgi:hypothetical protein
MKKGKITKLAGFRFAKSIREISSFKGFSLALGFGLLHGTVVEVVGKRNILQKKRIFTFYLLEN